MTADTVYEIFLALPETERTIVSCSVVTQMKHYKTSACLTCELFKKCTKNAKDRLIERSQYADLIYQNKIRIENNYEFYRRQQAIVEHPTVS